MKLYTASATSDYGIIYSNEQIKAGQWSTAFNRAGHRAQRQARRRPKMISITLRYVSTIKKVDPVDHFSLDLTPSEHLGLPEDETTPEDPI